MKPIVSLINSKAKSNINEFVLECEQRYRSEIADIVKAIAANQNKKIIMIAGPSGSGKTTTAHILRDYLLESGRPTQVVSLDDFYLNRENAPLDSEGNPDFETVYSLDLDEISRCFKEVIDNGVCDMPIFDFKTGKRITKRKTVDIRGGGIMIVEGLHALNPLLSRHLPSDSIYKIYISVSTSVCDDDGEVVLSSRQMRLIRRMSRDCIYRNTSPQQTYDMWERVLAGEEKFLYCFKPTADRIIATLHNYEPCVFRDKVLQLLSKIDKNSEGYDYILKTKAGLEKFVSVPESAVPYESLIREFIMGGKYE